MLKASVLLCAVSLALLIPFSSSLAQVNQLTAEIPDCIHIGPPLPNQGAELQYVVEVGSTLGGPVDGAEVSIAFQPGAVTLIAWCTGQPRPTISSTTGQGGNPQGTAVFKIYGGGCITTQPCAQPAAVVTVTHPSFADTVSKDITCVNSPDVINVGGGIVTCPNSHCQGGGTEVALADATYFTAPIKLGLVDLCTKLTPDPITGSYNAPTGLGDAVALTPYVVFGGNCNCP